MGKTTYILYAKKNTNMTNFRENKWNDFDYSELHVQLSNSYHVNF